MSSARARRERTGPSNNGEGSTMSPSQLHSSGSALPARSTRRAIDPDGLLPSHERLFYGTTRRHTPVAPRFENSHTSVITPNHHLSNASKVSDEDDDDDDEESPSVSNASAITEDESRSQQRSSSQNNNPLDENGSVERSSIVIDADLSTTLTHQSPGRCHTGTTTSSISSIESPSAAAMHQRGRQHHQQPASSSTSRVSTVVSFPVQHDEQRRRELLLGPNNNSRSSTPASPLHRVRVSFQQQQKQESPGISSCSTTDPGSFDSNMSGLEARHRSSSLSRFDSHQSDAFTVRRGRTLTWKDVNLRMKGSGKRPDRVILNHVWGEVPKKQTTAIMGPSGAGKTSLLNILSGRTRSKGRLIVEASVRLDNFQTDPSDMAVRQMIAFVAQDDSLPITETPREAIRFSAKLRLGRSMTDDELNYLTDSMLLELGLSGCADTIVGGALLKGISGGERKRTSIGVELVVKPAMVFLDEPTSGLDSFSAVQVCRLLKKVANAGASVLFTIHQPPSKIFREFDHLILLNKGRVMYQGPVHKVPEYFAARGHPCPDNYNPSDWMMKVAQKNSVGALEQCGFFPEDCRVLDGPSVPEPGCDAIGRPIRNHSPIIEQPPSFATQVRLLVWREMRYIKRDRTATISRVVQSAVMGGIIGLIFFNVGETSTASVTNLQSQFGAIVLILAMVMMSPAQSALLAFPEERPVFLREYSTRHYSVPAYFLSRLVMEAMFAAVQCFMVVTISFYMVSFKGRLSIFLGAGYLLAMGSTAIAVGVGAAAGSNSQIATAFLPIILLPQMIFIGYFVVPDLIPVWLRWLNWLCPMTYVSRIMLLEEFHECSDDPFQNLGCELLLMTVKAKTDEIWWYWLILIAQFVVFRLIALAILHRSAKKFY